MKKNYRPFVLRACWLLVALALVVVGDSGERAKAVAPQSPTRPNIVFILTDDQRWDALGSAGHPFIKTPNLDRLAKEGARFRNAFVSIPLCSPSRASFLTGQSFLTEYFAEAQNGRQQNTAPRARTPSWQAVRNERWKYIHYTALEGMDELYDLKADPYEMKNLIKEPGAQAALKQMKAELERLLKETS